MTKLQRLNLYRQLIGKIRVKYGADADVLDKGSSWAIFKDVPTVGAYYGKKTVYLWQGDRLRDSLLEKNPRAYHGTHQEVAVFVSMPKRELRNYEAIGTFVTTDKEHAKAFGKYVHQVDLPDVLKFYAQHDRDNLKEPFITPALGENAKFLTQAEKKLLKGAFLTAPKDHSYFDRRSYEDAIWFFNERRRVHEKADTHQDWYLKHPAIIPYVRKCERWVAQAREVWYKKLLHNQKYINFLWDWYTSRGYDGIAWENTCMDAGLHDSNDHRQSQYLIFHPDRYQFSTAD